MTLKRRVRLLKSDSISSEYEEYQYGWGTEPENIYRYQWNNRLYSWQVTDSEGHDWPKGRSVRDQGGPFSTVKSTYALNPKERFVSYIGTSRPVGKFSGVPFFNVPNADISPWLASEPDFNNMTKIASKNGFGSDLEARGTKLISSTIPTNPTVDGSVALAELFREGIPSMIGATFLRDRSSFFRSLGSEYLNYQFGWLPLVSDVKSAAKAIIESEKILNQLVRDSGKNVRRRRHVPQERQVETQEFIGNSYPVFTPSSNWWSSSQGYLTDTYTRDTWFSGCYTFEYDPGNLSEISRIATQARLLYGIQLTPEVLWNLAPWSWLVDWFANVGPLLNNVSAFQNDQLVLRYGYVMDRHRRDFRVTGNLTHGLYCDRVLPTHYGYQYSIDWKRREKANPYGFGIASSSFTTRQWAILGALGITRTPRTL